MKQSNVTVVKRVTDLPDFNMEQLEMAGRMFAITCIRTNAETMKLTISGFHSKEGEWYGDWLVTCRKLPAKSTRSTANATSHHDATGDQEDLIISV